MAMQKKLPREVTELIARVFEAYSGKNFSLLKSVYRNNVVIVDGFAPFRWAGPNALDKWWADVKKWVKAGGVQKEHLAYEGICAWGLSGDRAYASISATLMITLSQGKPIVRPGILTLTFARRGKAWKAEGHTWGRLS
jgi:ketosteroid isomerase-like protein